jgi:uncharacterized membrane protein YgdD (TMEM256/DUF423 family)
MTRLWFFLGAINGFLAVAAGAFGAHGLKTRVSADMLAVFETGARYQMYHALALLAAGWIAAQAPSWMAAGAGWCFLVGIILFSGSLYALSLSGLRWLGAITPFGGTAMLIGWALLAAAALRLRFVPPGSGFPAAP